jgi:hypothetical protein
MKESRPVTCKFNITGAKFYLLKNVPLALLWAHTEINIHQHASSYTETFWISFSESAEFH